MSSFEAMAVKTSDQPGDSTASISIFNTAVTESAALTTHSASETLTAVAPAATSTAALLAAEVVPAQLLQQH